MLKDSWPQGSKYVVMDSYCKAYIFSKSGWWPSHLDAKKKKLLTLNRVSLFFFLIFVFSFYLSDAEIRSKLLKCLWVVLEAQGVKPTSHPRNFSFKSLTLLLSRFPVEKT